MTDTVTHITTPAGEELVLLSRAAYERLSAGSTDQAEASAATAAEPIGVAANLASDIASPSPLRALRTQAGITQAALAELSGVDVAVICALEAGEPAIDPEVCARIAAAMNVPSDLLRQSAPS